MENRLISPVSVRNTDQYSRQVRDMYTSNRSPRGQEGKRYNHQELVERVPYGDKRDTFGHVQDKS